MPSFLKQRFAQRTQASASDSSLKEVLTQFPGVISFAGGLPDPKAFDMKRIASVVETTSQMEDAWQYTATEGWRPLREKIAEIMQRLGVQASWRNVIVTNGSQAALELLAKTLLNPNDTVLVEMPGYLGAIQAFQSYEARVQSMETDEDGLIPERIGTEAIRNAKLMYTVSTFHNPTGSTLPPHRRRALAQRVAQHDGLLIEDGAYHWLAYDTEPPKPIAAYDTSGHIIYMGSFSKVLLPGVRIGWIVAPEPLTEQLALVKQSTDLATNTFGQFFVYEWLNEYGLRPPINLYRKKRDAALHALQQYMPSYVQWNQPQGGFFIWLTLPATIDAKRLLSTARQNGVTYVPGAAFGAEHNTLRFSFSETPEDDIKEGVQRLANTIQAAYTSPPETP